MQSPAACTADRGEYHCAGGDSVDLGADVDGDTQPVQTVGVFGLAFVADLGGDVFAVLEDGDQSASRGQELGQLERHQISTDHGHSIGDMMIRLRTVMAPIRPGANRCGKPVTQDQGYRSASV